MYNPLIDLNNDGKIRFNDFMCDQDGDGACDTNELQQYANSIGWPEKLNNFMPLIFDLIDTNEDGKLSMADTDGPSIKDTFMKRVVNGCADCTPTEAPSAADVTPVSAPAETSNITGGEAFLMGDSATRYRASDGSVW